jgi:hypothetical protein
MLWNDTIILLVRFYNFLAIQMNNSLTCASTEDRWVIFYVFLASTEARWVIFPTEVRWVIFYVFLRTFASWIFNQEARTRIGIIQSSKLNPQLSFCSEGLFPLPQTNVSRSMYEQGKRQIICKYFFIIICRYLNLELLQWQSNVQTSDIHLRSILIQVVQMILSRKTIWRAFCK